MSATGLLTVLLVRHAAPVRPGTPGYIENERPLTTQGLADAEQLASEHDRQIDAIYSSPYRRALQTVEPLAKRRALEIEVIDDLRERYLMEAGLPDSEWVPQLRRAWQDFDYAPPGGETSRIAQMRVVDVLDRIREKHPSGIVAAASHGNLIALALNAFDPSLRFDFWRAMPIPAIYELRWNGDSWQIVAGPNLK